MLSIAAKSLWARKRRLTGTLLAVGLGVAFLAGTLLLSDTLRANFGRLFTQANGSTSVVIRSTTQIGSDSGPPARTGIDLSLLTRVKSAAGVADAQPYLEGYGQLLGSNGRGIGGNGPPTRAANWISDPALNPYRLVQGHAPAADDQVVINRGAARTGHLALGMTTTLLTPQPLRVRIVGIATFGTADGFGPSTFTGLTLHAAKLHLAGSSPGEVSQIRLEARPGVSPEQLVGRLRPVLGPGLQAITGAQLAAENLDQISSGFLGFLSAGLTVFAAVALLVAAFSIYNTFSIVAAQRSRESALLRALGGSRCQLAAAGMLEALAIGLAGSVAGWVAGIGIAALLKGVFDSFGFALPAGGLVFKTSSSVLAVTAGVVVLGPVAARPAVKVLGAPIATLRGINGRLARDNVLRNPRRTAATASALLVGVAVAAMFTVIGVSMKASAAHGVDSTLTADLVVDQAGYGGSSGGGGFSPQLATRLARVPGVQLATGVGTGSVLLDGHTRTIAVAAPASIAAVVNLGLTSGGLASLNAGSFAVSAKAAADQHWRVGTTVPVIYPDGTRGRLRVAAIFNHPDITGDYLFTNAGWIPHAGQALDSKILIKLRPGSRLDSTRADVAAATAASGKPSVQDRAQSRASATSGVNTILGLVYVMLALAIVIALMGVANTLSLSIHERTRELGLLRALGQTRAQARGMIRWESVIISVFGTAGGVILGTFLGWAVVKSSSTASLGVFAAPPLQLILFLVLGALAGILAGIRPARRAARLNMLAAIAAG